MPHKVKIRHMSIKSDNIIAALDATAKRFNHSLTIVETGTIRNVGDEYEYNEDWVAENYYKALHELTL